jgi:hypothetical protein
MQHYPGKGEIMTTYAKPLPKQTAESEPFWQAAREHRLLIQQCTNCDTYIFYPRVLCPQCSAIELKWVQVGGKGTVYSYTVIRRPAVPSFAQDIPYVFAIVELEEGPRMATNIINCRPEEVRIGLPIEVSFDDVTPEVTLVKFQPAIR